MNPEENIPTSSPVQNFSQVPPVQQQQVPQQMQQPQPVQQPQSVTPVKIGKFKASKMIVRESWNILKQDKELAWFPVFSAIASLFALIVLVLVFFFAFLAGDMQALSNLGERGTDIVTYGVIFVYCLVMLFITNYFMSGLYIVVDGRFRGQNLSLGDGIRGANQNIGKIFIWSLISATVGLVLRIISDKSKWLGKLVAFFLGAAWAILTYFSLPSLVIGQRSVLDSFKESAALIRKTWGETIIINFGVGLFFTFIFLGIFAVCAVLLIIAPVFEMFILVCTLFVFSMIGISIISSTLSSIFKLALYEFALTGNVPAGFTPDLVKGAVKAGK